MATTTGLGNEQQSKLKLLGGESAGTTGDGAGAKGPGQDVEVEWRELYIESVAVDVDADLFCTWRIYVLLRIFNSYSTRSKTVHLGCAV